MRVGSYEVLGEVGRGGMGVVFRARAPEGALVALKLYAGTSSLSLSRFERERQLLSPFTLEDGFVPLIDAGELQGRPWFVMPFVPGGTLRAKLQRGALPIDEVIAIAESLATALARAHAEGIVHRDLKPENVLFDAAGRALVADLGLAKHFADGSIGASQTGVLSRTGEIAGTAGYMAPEQARDAKSAGPEADVFSVGAILWECLAGWAAFEGATLVEVLTKVVHERPPPVSNVRPETPTWLASVVERALAHDPAARFADGGELAAAIRARRPVAASSPQRSAHLLAGSGAVAVVVLIALVLVLRAPSSVEVARVPSSSVEKGRAPERRIDGRDLARDVERFTSGTTVEPGLLRALAGAASWRSSDPGADVGAIVSATAALIERDARSALDPHGPLDARATRRLRTVLEAFGLLRAIDPRVELPESLPALLEWYQSRVNTDPSPPPEAVESLVIAAETLRDERFADRVVASVRRSAVDRVTLEGLLRRIVAVAPRSATAHHHLANALADPEEKLLEYRRALDCPDDDLRERYWSVCMYAGGSMLLGKMAPAEALEQLDAVWAARSPLDSTGRGLRGLILLRLHEPEEAAKAYETGADEIARAAEAATGKRQRALADAALLRDCARRARDPATRDALDQEAEAGLRQALFTPK